ncbi:hypothetical protein U9M48_001997 [Paspalum notatum var. saurae]|uniref:VWFA domain-containing protein n=1 Tax=Paspalum notatum var. saurae TaxID=547442 RepID=A0AAQ3PH48_PASNO
MQSDEEPPPPPSRPAVPARPKRHVQLTKYHSPDAPLVPNDQKVLLELTGISSAASRAPLDLVAVIDVSGSMEGDKLENVKNALRFVIHKLTDQDRLCIVIFDDVAERLCLLRPVSEASRAYFEGLVGDLKTRGGTNIRAGLEAGLDVVVANRKITTGRAANVMLMSDGQDNFDPTQLEPGNVAVHTYGFGADHDPVLMRAIAERSLDGLYSSVPDSVDPKELTEAFAPILGGLTTIIAQDLELIITATQGEATIKKVDAGTYRLRTSSDVSSSSVTVSFGTLYSAEVRSVIVQLALNDRTASPHSYRANVAEVQYRFSFQGQQVNSSPERITIHRKRRASDPAIAPPRVQKEVARLQHVASIEEAIKKADGGELDDARNILGKALEALERVVVDPIVDMLRRELRKLLDLFKTEETYRKQGRATAISSLACHGRQRGGSKDTPIFDTPRMHTNREQAKQPDDMPVPSADQDAQQEEPEVPQDVLPMVLRLLAAVLSLLAFSIIASARTSGWDGGYYEPYRYGYKL